MKIALTCSVEGDRFFQKMRYVDYAVRAGEMFGFDVTPVILPVVSCERTIREYASLFDGFIFTGGDDVEPCLYGEKRLPCCGESELCRDEFELALLRELIRLDKPVFGICRGIQVMNVALSGTLWQDFRSQLTGVEHVCDMEKPVHEVKVSGFLRDLCREDEILTNSYHHQSVKVLGDGFSAAAVSKDGIIEAAECVSLRYFKAVQWHPEMAGDRLAMELLRDFYEHIKNIRG